MKTLNGVTDWYLYDEAGDQLAKLNASGVMLRTEVYAGGRHLVTYDNSGTPSTDFIFSDWLGNMRLVYNQAGNTVETCQNWPFGDALNCSNGSINLPSAMHFAGKPRDAESGLDDFGARFYDAGGQGAYYIGRFMTPDWSASPAAVPYANLSNPQSFDLYPYSLDNPITFSDTDGHFLGWGWPSWENATTWLVNKIKGNPPPPPQLPSPNPPPMAQQQNQNSTTTTVTLNSRPANIPGGQLLHDAGVNHEWISTPDGTDVGMGTAQGVPQSDAPGVQTQVVDHTGQVPTSTQTFTGVNKAALATYTKVGTPTGRWVPGVNDCNTWAHGAINNSTPHDITMTNPMAVGPPIVLYHNVVVYADGSIHSPGGP